MNSDNTHPTIASPFARKCEQQCGKEATTYAIDPLPGGWGGYYCQPCAEAMRFQVVDRYENGVMVPRGRG
jgi:hypothetical protein